MQVALIYWFAMSPHDVYKVICMIKSCDEPSLGIPYQGRWIVVFVVKWLVSALIIPSYLICYVIGMLPSDLETLSSRPGVACSIIATVTVSAFQDIFALVIVYDSLRQA
ncbi:hypothetical protein V6N13_107418 [Hibiscus sabdariffa]|uniref:Uncharacterized protein n=1 Tax=Hibiscus sabdariffa TaxID=183260 RepID=A0ABR2SPK4_9ROSI